MPRFGGIPNTRQFRNLIREEALPFDPNQIMVAGGPYADKFHDVPFTPTEVVQSATANLPVEMAKQPLEVATSNNDYSQVFEVLKQKRDEAGGIDSMPTETPNDRHLKMLAKNAEKKGNIPPYEASAAPFGATMPSDALQSFIDARNEAGGWENMPNGLQKETIRLLEKAGTIPPYEASAPADVVQSAVDNLPVETQKILMPDSVSPIAQSGISEMDTDIDREIERALAGAMAPPSQETVNADIAKLMGMEPQVSVDTVNPVTAAVQAAVGNGQPTTDNTVLAAQPVTQAQPDFMTQLNDLIAQMQGEQTAAAEQQQQQQQQTAEMAQNYMIGQPAVGYNPYQSGQYQNNPYGAAGVPNMGGITSIPVPAPYQAPRTMT